MIINDETLQATKDLGEIVGPENIVHKDLISEHYLVDIHRKTFGQAMMLVKPSNSKQVSDVLKYCYTNDISVVPFGGNTGYCSGAIALNDNSVILSLEKLDRIREIDEINLTLTVEAGVILENIQKQVDQKDLYFPLHLGSSGSCQIGGNLSTNAGGVNVLKYGMVRQFCIGLEIVLADGSLIDDLNLLRKNNSGYDLKQLFIGSEGTLGIITAATFMLTPKPVQQVTAMLALKDTRSCVAMLKELRRDSGDLLTSYEYFSRASMDLVEMHRSKKVFEKDYQHFALIEFSTSSKLIQLEDLAFTMLEKYIEDNQVLDTLIAQNQSQRKEFWHWRESMPEAEKLKGNAIKHDVSMSVSNIPEFIDDLYLYFAEIRDQNRTVPEYSLYGHIGDGNLHISVIDTPGCSMDDRLQVSKMIYELTDKYKGSFSAEHGIGLTKKEVFHQYKNPKYKKLMYKIKKSLDDKNIMNPGKIFD